MPVSALNAFGLNGEYPKIQPFGSGLINHTWKIISGDKEFILQRINDQIFKVPEDIAYNIRLVAAHLSGTHPGYKFVAPVAALNGEDLVYSEQKGYFRVFPFVKGSHSKEVLKTASEAYEAAKQFGKFTNMLSSLNAGSLKITIPCFHDLTLRYGQFLEALENGNKERIDESAALVNFLKDQNGIVEEFKSIVADDEFKLRVTHHDTKISNVLFDEDDNGLCVIDLDTIMPGYFISDVGDMMRTYLSPVSEEEEDFSKIVIRDDFYKAIVDGYYGEMKKELTAKEKGYFFYAGKFMTYMQALRFLTDHINDDVYYGAKYVNHNLVRTGNQVTLLQRLLEKEKVLKNYLPAH